VNVERYNRFDVQEIRCCPTSTWQISKTRRSRKTYDWSSCKASWNELLNLSNLCKYFSFSFWVNGHARRFQEISLSLISTLLAISIMVSLNSWSRSADGPGFGKSLRRSREEKIEHKFSTTSERRIASCRNSRDNFGASFTLWKYWYRPWEIFKACSASWRAAAAIPTAVAGSLVQCNNRFKRG